MILLAAALALTVQPPDRSPPRAPSAREMVERQLAKPAAAASPRLTASEAAAIRGAYLKSIGSAPRTPGSEATAAPNGSAK